MESKPNSTESTILKLPTIRHDNCSQVEEILTEERVDDDSLTCLTCQKSIIGKTIACLQFNMNCHKDRMVALGIDFICLSCKALDSQINTQEVSPSQNVGNLIQSQDTQSISTPPKIVLQSKPILTQVIKEQDHNSVQTKTITLNSKPVNNPDAVTKQRELRQWEQRLRELEESLKLKDMKHSDQDNEKQRLHEYINKLEARNDELSSTINTLQRRIDILENPLAKNKVNVGRKEIQQSTAYREEVDDQIIGVRERVTWSE